MNYKRLSISIFLFVIINATLLSLITSLLFIISFDFLTVFSIFILSYIIFSFIIVSLSFWLETKYVLKNEKLFKDEIEDFTYFREIIDNYTIGNIMLCYGKYNYKDFMTGLFLKLLLDKKISISDNKVIVNNEDNLVYTEAMFIKIFKGFNVYGKEIKRYLYEDSIQESKDCNLFSKEKSINSYNMYSIIRISTIILIVLNILFWLYNYSNNNLFFGTFEFISVFLLSFLVTLIDNKYKEIIVRSKLGLELQKKMIGLKNFFNDFTTIGDKKIKELGLWEYYLIYAVILNIKGDLNKEGKNIYNNYIAPYLK